MTGIGTQSCDLTDNFMPWHHGVVGPAPIVSGVMDVSVTNAAKFNRNLHILCANTSAGNQMMRQW
jgi:hypothetical protein